MKTKILLVMFLFSITAFSQLADGDFQFTTIGSTGSQAIVEITDYTGNDSHLFIPFFLNNQTPGVPFPVFGDVTSIAVGVFSNRNLSSVDLPFSLISIGDGAFHDNSLTTIDIPDLVTSIGENAFLSNSLRSVELGSAVNSIGRNAFFDNINLTSINSKSTNPANIANNIQGFNRANIDLTIPAGTSAVYISAGWTGFKSVKELVDYDLTIGVIDLNDGSYNRRGDQIHLTNNKVASIDQLSNDSRHIAAGAAFINKGTQAISLSLNPRIEMLVEKNNSGTWQTVYRENILGGNIIPGNNGADNIITAAINDTSWFSIGDFRVTYTAAFDGVEDGDQTNNTISHTFSLTQDEFVSKVPLDANNKPIANTTAFPAGGPFVSLELGSVFYFDNATTNNLEINGITFSYILPTGYNGSATHILLVNIYRFTPPNNTPFVITSRSQLTQVGLTTVSLTNLDTAPKNVYETVTATNFVNAFTGAPLGNLQDGYYFISVQIMPSLTGGLLTFTQNEVPNFGLNDSNNYYLNHLNNVQGKVVDTSTLISEASSNSEIFNSLGFGQNRIPAISLKISSNLTLSTADLKTEEPVLSVYPNPTIDKITLDSSVVFEEIILINSTGQQILSTTKNVISLGQLPAGMYLLQVKTATGIISKKIIKK